MSLSHQLLYWVIKVIACSAYTCTVLHTKRQKLSLFDTFEIFSAILQANHIYNIST